VEYWDSTSQKAAWALTAFGQKAVNSLIEVVNSPNDEWSLCMATDALGGFFGKDGFLMGSTMDNPRIAKILSDALDRPDCSSLCQKHVLDALNILGASSVAALAGIRRILRSSDVDKEVLNSALSVLITLGPLAHEMRNDVKDILTARGWEEDPGYFSWGSTYLKAALTLAAIGETAVPLLIQTLDWKCTDNAESRWAAIRGIQELPKPLGEAAIPALWNSLADPNAQVQEGAMRALNVLLPNKREEINQEAEQLKEDFEGMVRKILKMPPHRREVAIGNLNRKPDKTRIEFYQAISALDTQANDLVWVLEDNALNDPNPKVREAAANALKDMEGVHAYRAFRRVKQAYKEAKEAEFLYDDHDSATPGNFSVRVRGTLEAMTRLQGMFSDLNQLENMESSEIDLSGVDKIHMEFELEGTKMSMELTPKDGGLELGNSEEDRENGEREPPVFKPEVHDFRPWPNG
jgi:hypothetical protein